MPVLAYDLSLNFHVLLPSLVGLLCGALIGFERARSGRAAGVRTYALVSMASAMLMAVSASPDVFASVAGMRGIDPTRAIQGVVTGVGFLGAGVIFREGFDIRGLTSASAIWAASVVGILAGVGLYPAAVLCSLIVTALLSASPTLEKLAPKRKYLHVQVHVQEDRLSEDDLLALMHEQECKVLEVFYKKLDDKDGLEFAFTVASGAARCDRALARALSKLEGVTQFAISPVKD